MTGSRAAYRSRNAARLPRRAVAAAKFSRATIITDFQNQRIEVVVGEGELSTTLANPMNEWLDDDV